MIDLAWLIIQLLAWLTVIALTVLGFAFVVLAPPFFAGRYVWLRFRQGGGL